MKKIVAPKLVKKLPVGIKGIKFTAKNKPTLSKIKFFDLMYEFITR